MTYVYLALAIAAEVAGTTLLKATEEFTKLIPTTFLVIFYLISFWLMTLALRELYHWELFTLFGLDSELFW